MKTVILLILLLVLIYRERNEIRNAIKTSRSLFVGIGLAVLAMTGLRAGVRALLAHQYPCHPPCHRLRPMPGSEKAIGLYGSKTVAPEVEPLQLTLALDRQQVKMGTDYALGYKVTLRNDCDARIQIPADFFQHGRAMDADPRFRRNFYFVIWGPDGRATQPEQVATQSDDVTETSSYAIPYIQEAAAAKELAKRTTDYGFVALAPGESLETVPSVFWPHREVLKDRLEPDAIVSYVENVPVDPKTVHFPVLVPGFLVAGVRFVKPGPYRVQVVFDEEPPVDLVFPFYDPLPRLAKRLLGYLAVTPGGPSTEYHLHAESQIVDFKVMP